MYVLWIIRVNLMHWCISIHTCHIDVCTKINGNKNCHTSYCNIIIDYFVFNF